MSRIRLGENVPEDRKELFHIPYEKRRNCSSQRFSITGSPCLYLATTPTKDLDVSGMLEVSWMESGMPKKFSASLFQIQRALRLLYFGKSRSTYLMEYDNQKEEKANKECRRKLAEYFFMLKKKQTVNSQFVSCVLRLYGIKI